MPAHAGADLSRDAIGAVVLDAVALGNRALHRPIDAIPLPGHVAAGQLERPLDARGGVVVVAAASFPTERLRARGDGEAAQDGEGEQDAKGHWVKSPCGTALEVI